MRLLIKIAIVPLILFACNVPGPGIYTFDINFSEEVTFDKSKRLKFSEVIEDSRCPVDVECVWAGRVEVGFEYKDGNESPLPFTLALDLEQPELADTTIGTEYTIELISVLPQPISTNTPSDEDYQVRVVVTKL